MQTEKYKKIIFHPLALAVAVFLIVHIFNITRFNFLAEKDSYTWLLKYGDNLKYNSVDDYRQLFSVLIISIYHLTGLPLFDIFKYLMPFSFLTVFIPLWLVVRNLKNKFSQFLILLAPLGSATVLLQIDATRPQIIAMLFLYFSLGISMMAKKEENYDFSMILLGFLAFIGSLYHRVFAIFMLVWIASCLYNYRKIIWQNKTKFAVSMFLAVPWLEKVDAKNTFILAFRSLQDIFDKIFFHTQFNFQFPAFYTNIDNRQMGWGNLAGVVKYYAFYAGPFFISLLLLFSILLIFSKKFKLYARDNVIKKEFLFVGLLISFFIFIAEFLPRIGSIAYLPDRAWVFLGALLTLPLYLLLDFMEKNWEKKQIRDALIIFSIFLAISIAGGIYVNNSMKNIIPPYKMEAYEWIKNNIEPNSLFFSAGYVGALKYHSGMDVLPISRDVFKNGNIATLTSILKLGNKNQFDENLYKQNLAQLSTETSSIKEILSRPEYSYPELLSGTKSLRAEVTDLFSQVYSSVNIDTSKASYIFFSNNDENNPYKDRNYSTGYYSGLNKNDMKIIYNHPEYFTKVYDTGNAIIWKFLSTNADAE